MNQYDTFGDKIFNVIIYIILAGILIITLYPFWSMLVLSVSSNKEALSGGWHFYTTEPNLQAYRQVLTASEIWRSFGNSVIRVTSGTVLSVFLTALTAYPLSKKQFPLNKFFTLIIVFTMMFGGGLIPNYLLMKSLHLIDTYWVLILPGAVGAYNLVIMRNFFRSIPDSLEESAKIDGASVFTIWMKIIIPLSMPVLATVSLWVAVGHWNAYFDALIYITDRSKLVLQIVLRRILLENQMNMFMPNDVSLVDASTPDTVKAAIIMVSTLPIIAVYPFLQKYFVKGIMLGAVKG